MASNVSSVSLSNRALLAVGGRSLISSLDEGSPQANAVNTLFVPTFEQLGRTAWWNCLRKQSILTLLKAAQGTPQNPTGTSLPIPPSPWLFEYQLPSDCLHMRYIIPTLPVTGVGTVPLTTINNTSPTLLPTDGQIPFVVAYDTDSQGNPLTVILTNQCQAQACYTVDQPNPSVWDSQFQAAFVATLAAYLVPALTLHMPLMQSQIAIAERIVAEARAADANEGSNTQNRQADWMRARKGSGSAGYGNSLWGYPNYVGLSWPAY